MPTRKKTRPASAALIAILGAGLTLPGVAAADSQQQSVEELRDTVINLLKALVEQGVISQEKAQQLVQRAQEKAAADLAARQQQEAKQRLEEEGAIRVPYVPEIVKQEISKEVAQEVRPQVTADVVKEAKSAGWGVPGALPDWIRKVKVGGDVSVRSQADLFARENSAGCPPGIPYGNCTILDINSINAAGGIGRIDPSNEFLNVSQDRYRLRIRARLGADADLTDSIHAGVRISTGTLQDPGSEYQNIGSEFGRYTVGFDEMYIGWEPHTSRGFKFLTGLAGRFLNPYYAPTELVWQRDIAFDGAALNQRIGIGDGTPEQSYLWVLGGGFPVQEIPQVSRSDKWLVAGQLGASLRIDEGQRLTLAGAYYDFIRMEGVRNAFNSTLTNYTAPAFERYGNSVFDISNSPDPTVNLFALASRFRIADVAAGYVLPIGRYVFTIDAEAARNVGFNRAEILGRTGLDLESRTKGYVGDFTFGTPISERAAGSWRLLFGYRYVQRDAVVDALTDADFHLGGTNTAGYFIWTEFGLARDVWTRLRYLSGREIDGPSYRVDVIQLDLSTRF